MKSKLSECLKEESRELKINLSSTQILNTYKRQLSTEKKTSKKRFFITPLVVTLLSAAAVVTLVLTNDDSFSGGNSSNSGGNTNNSISYSENPVKLTNKNQKIGFQLSSGLSLINSLDNSTVVPLRKRKTDKTTFTSIVEAYDEAYALIDNIFNDGLNRELEFTEGTFLGQYDTYTYKATMDADTYILMSSNLEEDEEEFSGEITSSSTTYRFEGEIEKDLVENETENEITIYFNDNSYLELSHEIELGEQSYEYTLYENDIATYDIEMEFVEVGNNLHVESEVIINNKVFEYDAVMTNNKYQVRYSYLDNKGSFVVYQENSKKIYFDEKNNYTIEK